MKDLIEKVRTVTVGHDSLGPTGLTLHITAQERDAILNAFTTLERCRTILENMAKENEGIVRWLGNRWPIHHEPLRVDAKALLPIIDEALNDHD